jgi:thimet oligopeptidase
MARFSHHTLSCVLLIAAALPSQAQDWAKLQPPIWSTKPDLDEWEKMENDRIAAAHRAIDKLVAVKGSHTVENTVAPYDEAIRQLDAASNFAFLMQEVHPDAAFRDHATAMNTKANGELSALSLNRDVYQALVSVDVSGADAATCYYIKRQLLEFRLAGVDKDEATRKHLRELNEKLNQDMVMFDRNISDDVRTVEVANISELDGLPQDYIDAHKPGADGKIRITTNYPDFNPVMSFARNDDLRRKLWVASFSLAYPKNRDVLLDMMGIRYEIATTLGYASWADYNAADKMIGSGHAIGEFLGQFDAAARPAERREFDVMLAEKRKTDSGATEILPHEIAYLMEQVRRSQYNFDSQAVRPYLPYLRVKQGILDTAAALFHVSFRQKPNVPAWDPSVETWEVIENNKLIGRFYLDMHPRPGKYTHVNEVTLLDGIRSKQLPEAALVCNYPQPNATDPGLMDYYDAVSFFHEFGHLMHDILGGQGRWAGVAGTPHLETDFLEAPSQMLEEWMHSPQVLSRFARHYRTGEPIPAALVERMIRAEAFGRAGMIWVNAMQAGIAYDIYKEAPAKVDLSTVVLRNARQFTPITPLPTDEYYYAAFRHLAQFSSAYYTYSWDKVIAEDFFQQFDQKNLLAGDAPMRYRRQVLEPGASMSANDLVKNFLGRPQNTTALQKWLAEEFVDLPPSSPNGPRVDP